MINFWRESSSGAGRVRGLGRRERYRVLGDAEMHERRLRQQNIRRLQTINKVRWFFCTLEVMLVLMLLKVCLEEFK